MADNTFNISTTRIDPETGLTQYDNLARLAGVQDWSGFYAAIARYAQDADDDGTVADPFFVEWFRTATQANAGTGAASDLIRDYTAAQMSIRFGATISTELLDEASNAIANPIWEIQVRGLNGNPPQLPDLSEIRDTDAGSR
jgi:hypothetical protein